MANFGSTPLPIALLPKETHAGHSHLALAGQVAAAVQLWQARSNDFADISRLFVYRKLGKIETPNLSLQCDAELAERGSETYRNHCGCSRTFLQETPVYVPILIYAVSSRTQDVLLIAGKQTRRIIAVQSSEQCVLVGHLVEVTWSDPMIPYDPYDTQGMSYCAFVVWLFKFLVIQLKPPTRKCNRHTVINPYCLLAPYPSIPHKPLLEECRRWRGSRQSPDFWRPEPKICCEMDDITHDLFERKDYTLWFMTLRFYITLYVCMHACMYVHIYMYVCNVCMYVWLYHIVQEYHVVFIYDVVLY